MYSPKIKEELIPEIYRIARARGIRMTALVNEIIEKALDEMDGKNNNTHEQGVNQKGGESDGLERNRRKDHPG